jgi:hypothetical protein
LPEGVIVARLSHGVFRASALAAEHLARAEQERGLSVEGDDVTVDGTTYCLPSDQAAFVKELVDAGPGNWVSGQMMGEAVQPRPDRVFKRLPKPVTSKLESRDGVGYRIRPA